MSTSNKNGQYKQRHAVDAYGNYVVASEYGDNRTDSIGAGYDNENESDSSCEYSGDTTAENESYVQSQTNMAIDPPLRPGGGGMRPPMIIPPGRGGMLPHGRMMVPRPWMPPPGWYPGMPWPLLYPPMPPWWRRRYYRQYYPMAYLSAPADYGNVFSERSIYNCRDDIWAQYWYESKQGKKMNFNDWWASNSSRFSTCYISSPLQFDIVRDGQTEKHSVHIEEKSLICSRLYNAARSHYNGSAGDVHSPSGLLNPPTSVVTMGGIPVELFAAGTLSESPKTEPMNVADYNQVALCGNCSAGQHGPRKLPAPTDISQTRMNFTQTFANKMASIITDTSKTSSNIGSQFTPTDRIISAAYSTVMGDFNVAQYFDSLQLPSEKKMALQNQLCNTVIPIATKLYDHHVVSLDNTLHGIGSNTCKQCYLASIIREDLRQNMVEKPSTELPRYRRLETSDNHMLVGVRVSNEIGRAFSGTAQQLRVYRPAGEFRRPRESAVSSQAILPPLDQHQRSHVATELKLETPPPPQPLPPKQIVQEQKPQITNGPTAINPMRALMEANMRNKLALELLVDTLKTNSDVRNKLTSNNPYYYLAITNDEISGPMREKEDQLALFQENIFTYDPDQKNLKNVFNESAPRATLSPVDNTRIKISLSEVGPAYVVHQYEMDIKVSANQVVKFRLLLI